MINFIAGNALHIPLADKSVQCCVTSPPYWGLRDYGTAEWIGGDEGCEHEAARSKNRFDYPLQNGIVYQATNAGSAFSKYADTCPKCGAIRKDAQLGLERTPEEYVANLVAVFREVWRVLRDDGVVWLNLGDSYASDIKGSGGPSDKQLSNAGSRYKMNQRLDHGLKQKDLVGIPWRVAFALQADGWYLRSDIIWSKPNPMPESVTDRPTKAHEYVFLLTKSQRYFYDADAVREVANYDGRKDTVMKGIDKYKNGFVPGQSEQTVHSRGHERWPNDVDGVPGRNRRTVWTVATQPYKGAHFATMPEKLVEPCVLAGSKPGDTVLDPFSGSGTVAVVSIRYRRSFVGIELNEEYINLAKQRTRNIQPVIV